MILPTTPSASSIKSSSHRDSVINIIDSEAATTPTGTAPLYSKRRLILQEASCHATMLIAGWYASLIGVRLDLS